MNTPVRDWSPFALLLIDVQLDFWSDELPQAFPHFPENVSALLSTCRREGIDVIHLNAIFRPDMSDWMVQYKLRGRIPCIQGTPGAEPLPFAQALPGEPILHKQTFDGFQNPELRQILHQKGKRFLLTAGLVTSTCVLFTTVSAAQSGFLTALVEDCCADDPFVHEQTLETYPFIFERVSATSLVEQYPRWMESLHILAAQGRPSGAS